VATIDDALRLIKSDPVVGYVSIPMVAARPPRPGQLIKLQGHTLLLPHWSGAEWAWWGNLAMAIAKFQTVGNSTGTRDKQKALDKLRSIHPAMQTLGTVAPTDEKQIGNYYTAAVRLVIASAAAESGETFGSMAAESFKEALKEAPISILAALKDFLDTATTVIFADLPREAVRTLKSLFNYTAGKTLPAVLTGLGPIGIIAIGLGAWYLFARGKGD
jgi:hypothetical protein